jgi:hypothetical protein
MGLSTSRMLTAGRRTAPSFNGDRAGAVDLGAREEP